MYFYKVWRRDTFKEHQHFDIPAANSTQARAIACITWPNEFPHANTVAVALDPNEHGDFANVQDS